MAQHDFILLDRSGSMEPRWREAVSSINDYVATLKQEEVATSVTVATFRSSVGQLDFEVLREDIQPSDWHDLPYSITAPMGGTPLNDAIGELVALAKQGEYEKVALIIMTDGEELDSRRLTRQQAKDLLDECRNRGWQVLFLGADFDVNEQARSYGTDRFQARSVSATDLGAAMCSTAMLRAAYATTGARMEYQQNLDDAENKKFV